MMDRWIIRLAAGVIALTFGFRGLDWLARRGGGVPDVPTPNAYEDLLVLSAKVRPPPGEVAELGVSQIRQIAADNRATLAPVHALLLADSGVPLKARAGWVTNHENDLKSLKRLAVALALQSRADLAEGRTNDAVRSQLDVVLLGHAMARGGILVDGINALAVETVGIGGLYGFLGGMDAATCKSVVQTLEKAEARREKVERIFDNERRWSTASFGIIGRIGGFVARDADGKRRVQFMDRHQKAAGRARRLMLRVASRAFELEHGKPPKSVHELVPALLSAVPVDPATKMPFRDLPKSGAGEE